jgi:hypothetical protein
MMSPPNPAEVSTITYEYLFCPPSGANVRVKYPGYRGSSVTTQNLGYNWFPLATNGWEPYTLYKIKPPPLQAEKERPPT